MRTLPDCMQMVHGQHYQNLVALAAPVSFQIGPEGAIALAAALKVNPVLSYLNLSGTTIGACPRFNPLCAALVFNLGFLRTGMLNGLLQDRLAKCGTCDVWTAV